MMRKGIEKQGKTKCSLLEFLSQLEVEVREQFDTVLDQKNLN